MSRRLWLGLPCLLVVAVLAARPVLWGDDQPATPPTPVDADDLPDLSNVRDPAFDRYVDLTLLGTAWSELDAGLMTDLALQMTEGERVLRRPHKAISADQLLRLAARVAGEKRDQATLARIGKVADERGDRALAATVAATGRVAGQARAVSPILNVTGKDLATATQIQATVRSIEVARLSGSAELLNVAEKSLADFNALSDQQKAELKRLIADARKGLAGAQPDAAAELMIKLSAGSRSAAGRPAARADLDFFRQSATRLRAELTALEAQKPAADQGKALADWESQRKNLAAQVDRAEAIVARLEAELDVRGHK